MTPDEQAFRERVSALQGAGDHAAALSLVIEKILADDNDPAHAAACAFYREMTAGNAQDETPQHLVTVGPPGAQCSFLVRIKAIDGETCDYEVTNSRAFYEYPGEMRELFRRCLDEWIRAFLELSAGMVSLQQTQKPHESIALLMHWLSLPAGDPRQLAAAELAKPMFDPGEDPRSTLHPDDPRFNPRLVVLETAGAKLNVGVRINGIERPHARFIQFPPLPPELQALLQAQVDRIAFSDDAEQPPGSAEEPR